MQHRNAGHPPDDTFDRLLDDELAGDDLAAVERHLAECDACRTTLARLRRVRRTAARLPREVVPPPEMWAAVRERLAPAQPGEARAFGPPFREPRPRRRTWRRSAAFAAGVLLVAALSFTLGRRGRETRVADRAAAPAATPQASVTATRTVAEVRSPAKGAADADAAATADAQLLSSLVTELRARRGQLAPETVREVEQNLQVINAAVAATRRALATDPNNVHLEQMLAQATRRRGEYLRASLALVAE